MTRSRWWAAALICLMVLVLLLDEQVAARMLEAAFNSPGVPPEDALTRKAGV